MKLSSEGPLASDHQKERNWLRAGALFGLLLLAAVIFFVKNLGEERIFVELISNSRPLWLLAGFAYQLTTYVCAGGVWWTVLNNSGVRIPLHSLASLGLAKLFRELHPVVLALATMFSLVGAAIPLSILWLTRPGERKSPKWARRLPGVSRVLHRIAEAPAEITRNRRLLWQGTILQLVIFTLDAATLDAMLRAIGHPTRPDAVFAGFSIAVVAATISLIPGGIGAFEGSSVLMLRFLNIPIEAGLAATLLLRGFTLWLPLGPGLIILRREQLRRNSIR